MTLQQWEVSLLRVGYQEAMLPLGKITSCDLHFIIYTIGLWELDDKKGWALKNWCLQNVVLEKTLESPLDSKEIKPVSPKGNQPWIFIGRTDAEDEVSILWPPDSKSRLIRKDPDAGKGWRQEEEEMTEDGMVGWHHGLNGHEFEQTLGHSEGQGAWHAAVHGVQIVGHDWPTEQQ